MYCSQCGIKSLDNAKFCTECGNSLIVPESAKVPESAEVPEPPEFTKLKEDAKKLADKVDDIFPSNDTDIPIKGDPYDANTYYTRGYSYYELDEYEKAVEDFSEAIELDPYNADVYYNRGVSYYRLGKYGEAVDDCTKAIHLEPDHAMAYYGRANSYDKLGEHKKAVDDYNKAIELNPDNAHPYDNSLLEGRLAALVNQDKAQDKADLYNKDKANDQKEVDTQNPEYISKLKEHQDSDEDKNTDGIVVMKNPRFQITGIIIIIILVGLVYLLPEGEQEQTTGDQFVWVESVIFNDEEASSFLLKPDDFPKNWTAIKSGMILDAKNDYLTDFNVKKIKITLATHETESAAQAAFSTKKSEAQATIDGRGISGDKLEDVKKYPLFVWNASSQANIDGVEKWTVVGVYGNITMKVYHEGSIGAPKKNFAVDIAKKQMDRLKSD